MEDRVGRDGEAKAWDRMSTPASAKSYYLRVLKPAAEKQNSMRNQREMHTMAVVLDHLALGRRSQAADVCAQRLKALELASETGSWQRAQYLELVEAEGPGLIDKEEEFMVTKEVELNQRIRGKGADRAYDPTYEPSWRPLDDGRDNHYKGKDHHYKGKDTYKGKDNHSNYKGKEGKGQGHAGPGRGRG